MNLANPNFSLGIIFFRHFLTKPPPKPALDLQGTSSEHFLLSPRKSLAMMAADELKSFESPHWRCAVDGFFFWQVQTENQGINKNAKEKMPIICIYEFWLFQYHTQKTSQKQKDRPHLPAARPNRPRVCQPLWWV